MPKRGSAYSSGIGTTSTGIGERCTKFGDSTVLPQGTELHNVVGYRTGEAIGASLDRVIQVFTPFRSTPRHTLGSEVYDISGSVDRIEWAWQGQPRSFASAWTENQVAATAIATRALQTDIPEPTNQNQIAVTLRLRNGGIISLNVGDTTGSGQTIKFDPNHAALYRLDIQTDRATRITSIRLQPGDVVTTWVKQT